MAARESERIMPSVIFSAVSIQVTHGSMGSDKTNDTNLILIFIIVLVLSNKSFYMAVPSPL